MAQRCASPPMKNLISVGGQHQGDTIMITLAHFPVSRADQIYSDVKVVFRGFFFFFFLPFSQKRLRFCHHPAKRAGAVNMITREQVDVGFSN